MLVTAFLPARYQSSRLPGKPLEMIGSKSMIQWTYEACCRHPEINQTIVLTDDKRIADEVIGFKGQVVMTSSDAENGTMRIKEVVDHFDSDIILNIQGDEPGLSQAKLHSLIDCIKQPQVKIATLVSPILTSEVLFDYNKVKVVFDENKRALYFSRQAIPALRDNPFKEWLKHADYYLHIGLYGFKKDIFSELVNLPPVRLEKAESLEQLRWISYGYNIHVEITDHSELCGIDTKEDLDKARHIYKTHYGK